MLPVYFQRVVTELMCADQTERLPLQLGLEKITTVTAKFAHAISKRSSFMHFMKTILVLIEVRISEHYFWSL